MLLIETSAWVDYLRAADTPARSAVRRILTQRQDEIVTCEPIAMELLAGATGPRALDDIERLVNGLPSLSLDVTRDFRVAATVFRSARHNGRTVRSLVDCLIAAVALRTHATVVHKDVDFDVIAETTGLAVLSLR